MKATIREQLKQLKSTGDRITGGPQWNAFKHGLRSAAVLLPGDDLAAFRKRRRELFQDYNPCTREEADCVESIVGYKWRIAYYQRLQAKFHAALNEVAGVYPATDHICEPDPHRWQHRAMDCTLEEMRLHKMMREDRKTLFELQWMRRHRLIDGAIDVKGSYLDFLEEEAPPTSPVDARPPQEAQVPKAEVAETPASPSVDSANSENRERNSPAIPVLRVGEAAARLVRGAIPLEPVTHPNTAPAKEILRQPLANPLDPR